MSYTKRSLLFLFNFFLCISITFSGCGIKNAKNTPNQTCKQFDSYTKNSFESQLKSSGLNLHFYLSDVADYQDVNMTLGDYSYESMKNSQKYYVNQINCLKNFNYNALTPDRKLTYDVLMDSYQRNLDFSDLCLCSEDLSSTIGIQAQLPVLFSEYEFHNETDIKNYLTLLSSVLHYYEQICDFQKKKASENCFISTNTCDAIIAQCHSFLNSEDISSNILHTSFKMRINNASFLNEKKKSNYLKKNESILKDIIFPAYHKIINTLTSLKNQGLCTNDNGLCYLKNGKDYYDYLVKNYTGSNLSIPEIKAMIQNQVVYDMKQLYSLFSLYPELETQISNTKTSSSAKDCLEDLKQKYLKDFPSVKSFTFSLKTVDKNLQDYLSPAFYIAPPIDNQSNNLIYVNQKKVTSDLYTVLAHEGIPGHMYQNAFFSATKPDNIRYITDCGGYSEGWAVYAELFSFRYQYENEPLALAMSYNSSYSLALYCLCDIGVNYEGWTFFELQEFLANYNIEDSNVCKKIFQAVIEDPANYLKYYVGYLEILKTKKYVMEQVGADFDLKKFHKAFLSIGPTSFEVVHKWILYYYNHS